jgi:phage regulator Rha-like protein
MQLTVIQQKIYEIRGHKVMLDFNLAELYGLENKYLKRAVRQNIKRFPLDFMFELTPKEWESLRRNFSTSNKRGGTRYMPFAFTEQGIGMLSGVLNSDKAVQMHIAIVRAFVALKQFVLNYKDLATQINAIRQTVGSHSEQLNQIYDAIENMMDEKEEKKEQKRLWKERERIGFKK